MKSEKDKGLQIKRNNCLVSGKPKSRRRATPAIVRKFKNDIYSYYKEYGRDLPWRKTQDPYHILVSEIMLQQTQVQRVMEKYEQFTSIFPNFPLLARAPLRKILKEWQGMGYNRRAISLKQIAQKIVEEFDGNLPASVETLMTFPGIGKATASAIAAFAFQHSTVFIETNIRRVFIHCFFHDMIDVRDSEILPLVERTLDTSNPREWYYALMDYGVMLKQKYENSNRRSAHYQKQSPFQGSNRQIRGRVLKLLIHESNISEHQIAQKLHIQEENIYNNLTQLVKEGFVKEVRGKYLIA
ncbi:MAG: A/G-specific adenine glycosylase [Candidatus Brocadiales bacterium]|nr:A/G-specific adenine glycosylase [Candidatus Brocadiales bacterium]